MRLRSEFGVGVPLERTWATLLDVPRVAGALAGATIGGEPEAGAWRGTMTVELDPVTAEYAGSARVQDIDEDARVVSYRVEGHEPHGQGSAAATITARLAGDGGGTRVVVETDLRVTGRQARLGHGLMEEVAGSILGDFAGRLERELRGAPVESDVGAAVRAPLLGRAGLALAGLLAGLALARVVWRR